MQQSNSIGNHLLRGLRDLRSCFSSRRRTPLRVRWTFVGAFVSCTRALMMESSPAIETGNAKAMPERAKNEARPASEFRELLEPLRPWLRPFQIAVLAQVISMV